MLMYIDMESEIPIYVQLRNQFIEGIATGMLREGEVIPSVRQLASDIGINLHTVNKVYALLKQEGFFTIHRKSGVIVSQRDAYKASELYQAKLKAEIRPLIAEAKCRGLSETEFLEYCKEVYMLLSVQEENKHERKQENKQESNQENQRKNKLSQEVK